MKRKIKTFDIDFSDFGDLGVIITISIHKIFRKTTYEKYTSNELFLPKHRLWRNNKKEIVETEINDILNNMYYSDQYTLEQK